MKKYFGTDGIRGKVAESIITANFMQKLGNASGILINKKKYPKFVITGQDTRSSGGFLKFALISGLNSAGINVLDLAIAPTPLVSFITIKYKAALGFIITASHNKFSDNGVKIFSSNGFKLNNNLEKEIENNINNNFQYQNKFKFGSYKLLTNAINDYIDNIYQYFSNLVNYKGKVIIDCAHGSASYIFENLLNRFKINFISIASNPNGVNINYKCGTTYILNIKKAIKKYKADLGIALDGDGDRIIIVDENAQEIDGDGILNILSKYSNICGNTKGIVGTQMTNIVYENYYKNKKIPFIRSQIGDKYILKNLIKYGYKIGGESSGHIINLNFCNTGDGLITAIQLLAIFSQNNKPISNFRLKNKLMKQILINIPLNKKLTSNYLKQFTKDIILTKKHLNNKGRVLIRLSGTEQILRVMVEANNKQLAINEAKYLTKQIKQKINNNYIN